MIDRKSVLVIGLVPEVIDFSLPGYPPGMDAAKVRAGLRASEDELTRLGLDVEICMTDLGETAEAVTRHAVERKRFDVVMIGAGVRGVPSNFILFEKLINIVHRYAPHSSICFNTLPSDTAAAVKRWL